MPNGEIAEYFDFVRGSIDLIEERFSKIHEPNDFVKSVCHVSNSCQTTFLLNYSPYTIHYSRINPCVAAQPLRSRAVSEKKLFLFHLSRIKI